MDKKGGGRRKPSPVAADITATADCGAHDLKALIHSHSLFFDRLVELIPARFYLPADDDKPWFQGLSKAAKAAAKAESRKNLREARRARLDPAKSSTTTLDLLKKSIEAEKSVTDTSDEEEEDDDEEELEDEDEEEEEEDSDESETEVDNPRPVISDDRSLTYEELRQRLHRRIEELRSGRNTRPPRPYKKKKIKRNKKKIRKEKKNDEEGASTSHGERKRDVNETSENKEKKKEKKNTTAKRGGDAVAPDISFGQVKVGGEDEPRRKKRKLSKQQQLDRARKLEKAKKDPAKGSVVSKKHSWKAAVSRASGLKIHDDPKLLKESMKKEKKRLQKNAEKWKERIKNTEKTRAEKQKTRTENIKERIHQKKMRRIEKREKKLMRPGFEGWKKGYINE